MTSRDRKTGRAIVISLCIATAVTACGGGSGDGGGGGTPPPPVPPPAFGASFSEIQASVFTPTCATSGCHAGASAPQGLRLDQTTSYGLLVNVASSEAPSILRVAPSDPDSSYLIQKLEGTASVGERMPLGGTPLTQANIDVVRQWITDGAVDDRTPSSDPIRVSALSQALGADLTASPVSVVAFFDRELDVSTVNANTFLLAGSGNDGTFTDGNETAVAAAAITTPATTPMSATFNLAGVLLADDTYQVRLLGSGASVILDIDANALDGEFSGTFPSGDGTGGGDFVATFTVATPIAGPTLDELQANLFGPTCASAGCHTGPTGSSLPSGMDLSSADATFASLVGITSLQQPAVSRVAAGDPDNSYLVQKVEGTAATGQRMPLVGGVLSQTAIDDIRQWISDGANR